MADFIMNDNGSITLNKKKKKTADFIIDDNGNITLNKTNVQRSTKSSTKKKKENSWFNLGAFDDGYDFGDGIKTLIGTGANVQKNITKGAIGVAEKAIDAGAYIAGGVGGFFGADDFKESTADFIKKDLIDEDKMANRSMAYSPLGSVNNILNAWDEGDILPHKQTAKAILGEDTTSENTLLGEKSQNLVQSGGQLAATFALQGIGVPWWLTTGSTAFGGEAENALKSGATYEQAGISATVSTLAEVLTEKLSGGISFGGKTADTFAKNLLKEKIANKTGQTLAKWGLDAVGEAGEEVLTEAISNVGRLSYEDKTIKEALFSEEALENYLDSAIGGAVLGGGMNVGRAYNSIKTGRDYDTGLTDNEQKIVDKEIENRKAQAQESGKSLTKKEIAKIEEEVKNDLRKGYISTDTIESSLGGQTYSQLKSIRDKKASIENQIKEIENKPYAEMTVAQKEQLDSLRKELEGIDTNTLETKLNDEMKSKTASDAYLQQSYREKANRSKNFTYDADKITNEYEKAVYESASQIMNDTNRSHEFVEKVAQIAREKGTKYGFVNSVKIKELGLNVEGKDVNGLVRNVDGKQEILINIDSPKALNTIVGHETTHLLEGTNEYAELKDAIFKYAQEKGDFDARQTSISELYKDVKDADIDAEITADLVGDYLFTDTDFVNSLSNEKPNVFKKIKQLIDDLVVKFTGTKEEKALREVQKKFREAYKQAISTNTDTKYAIANTKFANLTPNQQKRFDKAQQLQQEGKSKQEIWSKTGFEYKDSDGTYDFYVEDLKFKQTLNVKTGQEYKIEDVLEGELLETYPFLKDRDIIMEDLVKDAQKEGVTNAEYLKELEGIKGATTTDGKLVLNSRNLKTTNEATNVLSHEIQHMIQSYQENGIEETIYFGLDSDGNYYTKGVTENDALAAYRNNKNEIEAEVTRVQNAMTQEQRHRYPLSLLTNEVSKYYSITNKSIKPDRFISNLDKIYGQFKNSTSNEDIRYSLSEKGLNGIANEFGGGKNFWEANLHDKDLYGATYFLKHQESVKEKFKELNNINIEPIYKDIKLKGVGTKDANVQNFIKDNNLNVVDLANNQELLDKFYELEHEAIKKQFNIDDTEADEIFGQWKDYFEKQKGINETIWPLLRFEKDFENIIEGNTKEIDNIETAKLERQLVDDNPEFEKYVTKYAEKLFSEKVEYDVDDVMEEAKFNHGTTDNFEVGAYMTTDGSLLNFNYGGYRDDHRTIDVYDLNMKEFMDYGAIRMQPETPGFEMQVEPTSEQYNKLYDYIDYIKSTRKSDDAINIDIDKGNTYDSATYTMNTPTSKIISDVKTYWKTGQFPKQSEFAQFRYSLSKENDIAPTKDSNLTYGEDVKLQVEEAIAPVQEVVAELTEEVKTLKEELLPIKQTTEEHRALTDEDLPYFEQQYNEAPKEEIAPPEVEKNDIYSPDTISLDKKALKEITKNLKSTLGLNRKQVQVLEEIVQEYSNNRDANINDLRLKIFNEFGTARVEERNEEIFDIKQEIKGYKINVSDNIKNDIADYFKFQQSNFGKIRFSKEGRGVDTVYQELSEMYPQYFPDDIYAPTDQLLQIAEVANLDGKDIYEFALPDEVIEEATEFIEESVQNYKNSEYLKAATEASRVPVNDSMVPVELVDNTVDNVSNGNETQENVQLPVQSETQPVEENKNLTIKESNALKVQNLEKQIQKYRSDAQNSFDSFSELIAEKNKQYDALKNKDTKKANQILQQVSRLNTQRDNIQIDYDRKMNNLQERINKMNSKEFKTAEQRQTVQQQYRQLAKDLIGDTTFWKDKKMGIQYQINTMKRNLRDIIKGFDGKADIATADRIYDEYFRSYDINQAQANREANAYKQKYVDLKLTAAEHEYIQMLGEFKYNPETTLTEDQVQDYLAKHRNKIDENKVDTAIEFAKKDYDELFNRINTVLKRQGIKELEYRKGYFPHFTEDKQGFLAKLFDWKTVNDEIPTDIAGLTELNNPEKSWQGFNKHRQGDKTTYNFGKGFDTYLSGALDWIHHIEDIQKIRALENEIRYQHSDEGVKEQIEAVYADTTLDADQVQERIDSILSNAANPLNNFVTDLRNWTNNVAGKKSTLDRSMEYATNRKIYSTMTNISNRVSGNMVGGSISSALTNFIPITQSWGTVSPASSLKAMVDTMKNVVKDDGFINRSTFLTNRLKASENLYKSNWDKANEKVGILFDGIDSFVAQTITRSKYSENIKKGMTETEALRDADQYAKDVIGGRSKGDMPTIFNSKNPVTRLFTAFQLEVNNQYAHMFKDMPTEIGSESKGKLIKGYATMFLGAYAYNALYSALAGRDAAFDPIGMIEDILKTLGDDEEEPEDKFTDVFETVVQQVPFIGGLFGGGRLPISGAIPYDNPIEMITGTATDALSAMGGDEKALKDLTDEWLKPATYLALPFGGGQIKKTVQGLGMFDEDLPVSGSYTNGGDLRFPVEDTVGNRVQAAIFGQYSSKNAREYFDGHNTALKEKQIEEYKELDMPISDYWEYRKGLKGKKTNEDKIEYINELDVTDEQKNIMINNATNTKYTNDKGYVIYKDKNNKNYYYDEENDVFYDSKDKVVDLSKVGELTKYEGKDISNYGDFGSYEEFDYATKYPIKYKVASAITNYDDYKSYQETIEEFEADYYANGKVIPNSKRNKVMKYVNSLNLSVAQKAMLIKQAYPSFDQYNTQIVEYVRSLNISEQDKIDILEELNMEVKNGKVYWK